MWWLTDVFLMKTAVVLWFCGSVPGRISSQDLSCDFTTSPKVKDLNSVVSFHSGDTSQQHLFIFSLFLAPRLPLSPFASLPSLNKYFLFFFGNNSDPTSTLLVPSSSSSASFSPSVVASAYYN